jgi:hypothetical protein
LETDRAGRENAEGVVEVKQLPRIALLNVVLAIMAAISIAHGWYWGAKYRPHIVVNPPIECGPDHVVEEFQLGFVEQWLAIVAQNVISKKGQLPANSRELSRVLADQASEWGNKGLGDDVKINSDGEMFDCWEKPIHVSISADRVSVTSDSSLTYYFAELPARNSSVKQ